MSYAYGTQPFTLVVGYNGSPRAEASIETPPVAGLPTAGRACAISVAEPKRAIVERARRYERDCIFLGATGRSLMRRMTAGSVSASVAAHAPCSVEVARAPSSTKVRAGHRENRATSIFPADSQKSAGAHFRWFGGTF